MKNPIGKSNHGTGRSEKRYVGDADDYTYLHDSMPQPFRQGYLRIDCFPHNAKPIKADQDPQEHEQCIEVGVDVEVHIKNCEWQPGKASMFLIRALGAQALLSNGGGQRACGFSDQ